MRGALAMVVVVAGLGLPALSASAQAGGDGELDAARQRANAVAAELAEAQSRLATLEAEIARLEAQAADGQARQVALEAAVRDHAVDRFIRGAPPPVALLGRDLNAAVRADALAGFVARGNLDAVDDFRRAGQDVARAREGLDTTRTEVAAAAADVEQRVRQANDELARQQRLADGRREAEQARRRASEAAAGPGAAASSSRAPSPGDQGGSPPAAAAGDGTWLCPVQGPRAFSNDWGQPRSGGRRHQGNDILSPRGTPVVASVSGRVRPHQSSLGGSSYYLKGDDGNTYLGTHLDSFSGAGGPVEQGEVLGYVGSSGNASGGPTHLHFEIHPGGGGAVNPYPTLRLYC